MKNAIDRSLGARLKTAVICCCKEEVSGLGAQLSMSVGMPTMSCSSHQALNAEPGRLHWRSELKRRMNDQTLSNFA